MSETVLIVGPSGSGKSKSTENLDEKTFYICTTKKRLHHLDTSKRVVLGNPPPTMSETLIYKTLEEKVKDAVWVVANDARVIIALCKYVDKKRPEINKIVLDDWQYSFVDHFMRRISEKGYQKYNDIGSEIWSVANIQDSLERDDLILYCLTHSEEFSDENQVRHIKAKTLGKLVDNVVTLEGLFETVIYSEKIKDESKELKYVFRVRGTDTDTCKTPQSRGKKMFDETYIPNDLSIVDQKIREFYNLTEKTKENA